MAAHFGPLPGHPEVGHPVDEEWPCRRHATETLVTRGGCDELDHAERVAGGGRRHLVGLLERKVGDDQPIGARFGETPAELFRSHPEDRVGVGHRQ